MKTSIKDVVEEIFLESQSLDSIFRNKERYLMYRYAKYGLNKLNLSFASNLKAINTEIPFSCKVQKPDDYFQFVRAYLINCDGRTIEINRNPNIPDKIFHYLLNCDGTLIETCDENSLVDECMTCNPSKGNKCDINCDTCCGSGYYLPKVMKQLLDDLAKYKDSWISTDGEFFEFSSDLEGLSVMIEYIGNQAGSLSECQIFIDEEMEDPLKYFIRWKLLENGQDTMQQAQYFKNMFKTTRNKVAVSRNALSAEDVYSIMLMRK